MQDLIVLVADLDIEQVFHGILGRPESLQIRPISYAISKHPLHDAGCRTDAHYFLRPYVPEFRYALVVFDHQGSGQEQVDAAEIARTVEDLLNKNGWENRNRVVVLQPELEVWVWSNSPHVASCLGWDTQKIPLKEWLTGNGFWQEAAPKPDFPKEAMLAALAQIQKRPSPFMYRQLAEQVSFKRCTDESFHLLLETLQQWFSP